VTELALRGPKINPRRYIDPDTPEEAPERETASIAERR